MWNVTGKGFIAKSQRALVIGLLGLSVLSACQHKGSLKIIPCEILSAFNEYPDSSFFSNISSMCYQEGYLYLFDTKRGDIAVKGIDKDSFFTIGQIGQAPFELANPTTFTINEKGCIAVLDIGSLSLKYFQGKEWISSLPIPSGGESHFFIYQDTTYLTLPTDTTCYIRVPSSWERGSIERVDFCGMTHRITELDDMNLLRNRRHLIKGNQCLYTVCASYPIIEKYDLHTNQLLATIDLSKLDYLDEVCKFVKEGEDSPKSFYVFLRDACFYDGKLYILFADWKDGYTVNKIIVLEDNGTFSPLCIYQLPGNIYTSFTIGNHCIYAFNHEYSEVQTISLVDFH
ncbi:hypothetical protein [Phocaeicola sp.]|uniref:hypothetical protein n=1 Tax=Phocaeicola sp. TaxID=2773926 RepID=UPI0023CCDC84|nr:hypothetical protein [Phocaeicola sp.]MDE5677449.1 hypothetical protein [Phocaeicola sp.]